MSYFITKDKCVINNEKWSKVKCVYDLGEFWNAFMYVAKTFCQLWVKKLKLATVKIDITVLLWQNDKKKLKIISTVHKQEKLERKNPDLKIRKKICLDKVSS